MLLKVDRPPTENAYLCRMDYFSRLRQLLQQEKSEDRENYRKQTESVPVTQRRANGLAWYPIAIRGSEMSHGDYLTVEVERTTHQDVPHQLRFGASAVLFSQHDPKEHRAEGTISWQSGNRLKITLRTDELPDWADGGKLGIDLLFDDTSYEEMFSALQRADALAEKPTEGRLVRVLTGMEAPEFDVPINRSLLKTEPLPARSGMENPLRPRCSRGARASGHRQNHYAGAGH